VSSDPDLAIQVIHTEPDPDPTLKHAKQVTDKNFKCTSYFVFKEKLVPLFTRKKVAKNKQISVLKRSDPVSEEAGIFPSPDSTWQKSSGSDRIRIRIHYTEKKRKNIRNQTNKNMMKHDTDNDATVRKTHPQRHSNQDDRATTGSATPTSPSRKTKTRAQSNHKRNKIRIQQEVSNQFSDPDPHSTVMRTCLYMNTTVVTAVGIAAAAPVLPLPHLSEKQE
jgi:hypothetical protein